MLAQLQKDYPNDLRIVFRHLPLIGTPEQPFHDKAALSAQAAEAAGQQGRFWEMHDLLFERQGDWASLTVDQFKDWTIERAEELSLDRDQFASDLVDEENAARMQEAWDRNSAIGLTFTPFLLVNGSPLPNDFPVNRDNLAMLVDLYLLEKRQFTSCPPMALDMSKQYIATLHTEKGDIVLELFAEQAPLAVNSFVFLGRQGWFDGVTFHRVIPGFVAQGGDPSGTGLGQPGYQFINEISPDLKFDRAGLLAMANSGPDTNGSQFFITYAPTPDLDGGYTIFGEVISGMEVVESLAPRNPTPGQSLPKGDRIIKVTIEEK